MNETNETKLLLPPPESGEHGDAWYATTVLEYIISTYRYSRPELYEEIWREYAMFCQRREVSIGELSPRLGVFFNGWYRFFIQHYVEKPLTTAQEFLGKLKTGTMETEIELWHTASHSSTSLGAGSAPQDYDGALDAWIIEAQSANIIPITNLIDDRLRRFANFLLR